MKSVFTKKQIVAKLKALGSNWELHKSGKSISRTYLFPSYITGFLFITKVSVHAQVANHHPEIKLSSTYVKVTLTSDDVVALTQADFTLAESCES